jgi:hypothetical protein
MLFAVLLKYTTYQNTYFAISLILFLIVVAPKGVKNSPNVFVILP